MRKSEHDIGTIDRLGMGAVLRSIADALLYIQRKQGRPQGSPPLHPRMIDETINTVKVQGRPQGSPPLHPTAPALTMMTRGLSSERVIVRAGVEWIGSGDPCGRPYALPKKKCRGESNTGWVGLLALVFALTLSFLPFAAPAHAAAGTGRIYGQLLDGTKHDAPVVGQSVTLQMAQGDNTRDLLNVTTDAHGEFSFSGLDTDKTINYAVYTLYQGAQYYTTLIDLSSKPVQQINLRVYDATTSTANIAIVQATVLVDKVDAQNGLITISENYFFENLGLTSYVGSLQANGSKPNALLFALPTGARKLSLSSSFNGYQAIQVDTGFATNAALPPGTSQLAFSFQVPYTATGYDFSYTIVYPTVDLSLLVPLNIHASSSGMDSQGPVNVNQQTYQLFKAQKLLAGDQLRVQLQGLPAPQNTASPAPRNQNTLWIIVAILLMLAIVGVTWFVSRLSRRRATATRKQATRGRGDVSVRPVAKKHVSEASDRQEVLLQELLDLDTAYEAGKIKKAEYEERRAKTKALLRSVMNSEPVEKGHRERAIPGDQRTKKEF